MSDCIFCQIAAGEVSAKSVYRDDEVIAIEDLHPQAPVHVLVMPLEHYGTIDELCADDHNLAGRLIGAAAKIGRERGGEGGFRIVVNTGEDGGQTVAHVHVHVLAGRAMNWPPG